MINPQEDIDFNILSDQEFEGLCFELLWRNGYKNLSWRGGTDDQGRDIEGIFEVENPLIGKTDEKWYFECKKYKGPVPKTTLTDKIAWADANNADTLVFLLSSHLSNQTRDWLNKISIKKPYKIYAIEGNELKRLILNSPDLIVRYFSAGDLGLLRNLMKNWLIYNNEPSTDTLKNLLNNLEFKKTTDSELIYLISASLISKNRIFEADEGVHDLNFDLVINEFSKRVGNKTKGIIKASEQIYLMPITEGHFYLGMKEYYFSISNFMLKMNKSIYNGLHCVIGDGDWWGIPSKENYTDSGFEFLLFQNSNFDTRMRKIKANALEYLREQESKRIDQLN